MRENDTTIRTSEEMQRLVKEVAQDKQLKKKELIDNFVQSNVYDIAELSKGQESIRHFILELNQYVEWLNIKPPECNINNSIDKDSNLTISQILTLDDNTESLLKSCSSYTGESRSVIVRLCIIKGLYHNRSTLNDTKANRVADLWFSAKRKLETANKMMVTQLYCSLRAGFIEAKINTRREIGNLISIADNYKEFKETGGYDVLLSYEEGSEVDEIFKRIVDYVE